jgi:hypothetical protein
MRKTTWYWNDEKDEPEPPLYQPKMKKKIKIKKRFWRSISRAWVKGNEEKECDKE